MTKTRDRLDQCLASVPYESTERDELVKYANTCNEMIEAYLDQDIVDHCRRNGCGRIGLPASRGYDNDPAPAPTLKKLATQAPPISLGEDLATMYREGLFTEAEGGIDAGRLKQCRRSGLVRFAPCGLLREGDKTFVVVSSWLSMIRANPVPVVRKLSEEERRTARTDLLAQFCPVRSVSVAEIRAAEVTPTECVVCLDMIEYAVGEILGRFRNVTSCATCRPCKCRLSSANAVGLFHFTCLANHLAAGWDISPQPLCPHCRVPVCETDVERIMIVD